ACGGLHLRLGNRRLATAKPPALPFLSADQVHVLLGTGVIRGRMDITRLEAAHARVVLARNDRGEANWPSSDRPGETTAGPIALGAVDLPDLEVSWHDERAGVRIDHQALSPH